MQALSICTGHVVVLGQWNIWFCGGEYECIQNFGGETNWKTHFEDRERVGRITVRGCENCRCMKLARDRV